MPDELLTPGAGTFYYFEATDAMGKVGRCPGNAPETCFEFSILPRGGDILIVDEAGHMVPGEREDYLHDVWYLLRGGARNARSHVGQVQRRGRSPRRARRHRTVPIGSACATTTPSSGSPATTTGPGPRRRTRAAYWRGSRALRRGRSATSCSRESAVRGRVGHAAGVQHVRRCPARAGVRCHARPARGRRELGSSRPVGFSRSAHRDCSSTSSEETRPCQVRRSSRSTSREVTRSPRRWSEPTRPTASQSRRSGSVSSTSRTGRARTR